MTNAVKQPYTLVQALRELANYTHSDHSVAAKAAERIAALEAENARLRDEAGRLRYLASGGHSSTGFILDNCKPTK